MSYLGRVLLASLLLLLARVPAMAACGDLVDDSSAVTSVEASVADHCSCCTFERSAAYLHCARGVIMQAVDDQSLRPVCRRTVLAEAKAACPPLATPGPTSFSCAACSSDADCADGAFCECSAGTCGAQGGQCVVKPQVCPDYVAAVCGCDGVTYPNDCWRQAAGACSSHPGECSKADGCFDTIENRCTGAGCAPGTGCPLPNEFCTPACAAVTTTVTTTTMPSPPGCTANADCDDGNGCSVDRCIGGICEHACICVSPLGATCCPGPAALCVEPSCIPFFQGGCSQTSDCCQPCTVLQKAPCAVCLGGQCVGTP